MSHFHVPSRFVYRDESERDMVGLDDLPDVIAFYLEQVADRYRASDTHEMLVRELLLAEADALRATVI